MSKEYILVDLDRTLSLYISQKRDGKRIGPPIPANVERVVRWLKMGEDVRLFTARASRYDIEERAEIDAWCEKYIGQKLKVQNWKDFDCKAIWDDIAVTVEPNTGFREPSYCDHDPISKDEEEELVDIGLNQLEAAQIES